MMQSDYKNTTEFYELDKDSQHVNIDARYR